MRPGPAAAPEAAGCEKTGEARGAVGRPQYIVVRVRWWGRVVAWYVFQSR
jgi:hypothetical protein